MNYRSTPSNARGHSFTEPKHKYLKIVVKSSFRFRQTVKICAKEIFHVLLRK